MDATKMGEILENIFKYSLKFVDWTWDRCNRTRLAGFKGISHISSLLRDFVLYTRICCKMMSSKYYSQWSWWLRNLDELLSDQMHTLLCANKCLFNVFRWQDQQKNNSGLKMQTQAKDQDQLNEIIETSRDSFSTTLNVMIWLSELWGEGDAEQYRVGGESKNRSKEETRTEVVGEWLADFLRHREIKVWQIPQPAF